MIRKLITKLQNSFPRRSTTEFFGWIAQIKIPWFVQIMISLFVRIYKIDMEEAKKSKISDYETFNDFFARSPKENIRNIESDPNILVIPTDGIISQIGKIEKGNLIQAKNHNYTLEALLAGRETLISLFKEGLFSTICLSPKDFHVVYMPCDGILREMIYVPGDLFSVNQLNVDNIPNLFARNERIVCFFETKFGPIINILIGATIVGSIETIWSGAITPPRKGIIQIWKYSKDSHSEIRIEKGKEMGKFRLGSAVINLFSSSHVILNDHLKKGNPVKIGQYLAHSLKNIQE